MASDYFCSKCGQHTWACECKKRAPKCKNCFNDPYCEKIGVGKDRSFCFLDKELDDVTLTERTCHTCRNSEFSEQFHA